MQEFVTYEITREQKNEGKWILARVALITFYILFVVAVLIAGFITRIFWPLLAFIPISLWLLIFITWRYVCVEYEYSATSGTLTYCKIFGNKSRKRILDISLKSAVRIAPLSKEMHRNFAEQYHPEREFYAVSSANSEDVWFILFELGAKSNKDKRRAIFYFEPDEKMLRICRYYNPSSTYFN